MDQPSRLPRHAGGSDSPELVEVAALVINDKDFINGLRSVK